MSTKRFLRTVAVACIAALASVVAVAMPASAATVSVTIKVSNFDERQTYASLYAAPDKWVSQYELKNLSYGYYDAATKTVTFEGVPANKKVFAGFSTYGSSKVVGDYYVGATEGFAYPLVKPETVGTSDLSLKAGSAVTIPAPGKIVVKSSTAIVKGSSTYLTKTNGDYMAASATTKGGVSTFAGLVPGKYKVVYDGNSKYLGKTVGTVTVKAGKTTTITNSPKKASAITGKTTTSKGKAIKGVKVYATGKTGYAQATTNAKGKYTLAGLPAGTYKVTFGWPGDTHAAGKYGSKTVTVKGVKAGKSKSAGTTKLAVGATVSGSVAYAGSTATVIAVNSKGGVVATAELSKKKKSYKLQGLPKGKYKIYVAESGVKKPKYGVTSVTLKAGKTTKAKKISAKKATLTLSGKITGPGASKAQVYVSGGVWGDTVANSSGAYKVTGLVPGTYYVSAFAGSGGGDANATVKISKSTKKNFKMPAVTSVAFTYGGKAIVNARIGPFSADTGAKGVAKLGWVPGHKGQKPTVWAESILGYKTPYYFSLNKSKLNSKADVKALKVTGIGGK